MAATFRDLIAENRRKTLLLVAGFIGFTALFVFVIALAVFLYLGADMGYDVPWLPALGVTAVVTAFAGAYCVFSFYEGDQVVLKMSGAHLIEKTDDPQLFNVVEEMAIASGVPMPRVYLIDDPAPNAFATGRDPQHAAVAITRGLREKLNREELQGVMAHEMAHIRNLDIRLMLLLALLIGVIVILADVFMRMLWYAPRESSSSRSRNDQQKGGNPLMIVIVILAIVLAIVAPMLAQIIQMAVSRQREYLADASAVEFTRNPIGLANALRKIDGDPAELATATRGTAHLFIANPIKKFRDRGHSMLASHPPMKERIARLEALVQ